jgi:hypothetical protein
MIQDECRGPPLHTVLDGMACPPTNSMTSRTTVADCRSQQKCARTQYVLGLSMVARITIGSCPIPGTPHTHLREAVPRLLSRRIPRVLKRKSSKSCSTCLSTLLYLTHGDLLPRNVLVEVIKITGIID